VARTLYRIVKRNPPTREDFLSYEALGRVPRSPLTASQRESWAGVSTYDDKDVARGYAVARPYHGGYIATLVIEDDAPIRIRQTGRVREHHDAWGTPEELLTRVVAVERA
jgi:hypothetical protein